MAKTKQLKSFRLTEKDVENVKRVREVLDLRSDADAIACACAYLLADFDGKSWELWRWQRDETKILQS